MSTTRRRSAGKRAPVRTSASTRPSPLARSRRALARIPRAAYVCALLAFLNAACWSLITPPFLALDEPDHFAYVQQLAETGTLPSSSNSEYSQEEQLALEDLQHEQVRFRPAGHTIFSLAEQEKLQSDLAQPLSRKGSGGAGVAASEPPLYYALATVPYAIGSSGSILDRLELIRLLSAVFAGVTALFAFLFLREVLPRHGWAWTVGGLGVALGPLLGFASSTVNPDSLLFALAAAVFYCLARAFRHGLTQRLAIAIGVLSAAGLLTKLNFAGLAPGVALGLILLTYREAKTAGSSAYYRLLAPALAIAVSPGVLYGLVNILSNHHTFGIVSGGAVGLTAAHRSISAALSYIWQFYLPRLPGMHNDFDGIFTTRQIWFRNVIGLYGWGDTAFPNWVYAFALVPVAAIGVLCVRALMLSRAALRARVPELVTYAAMALGLLLLIGASGYLAFPSSAAEFTDARYLLPLVVLWGAVLALAARGAGRRWGPAAGALIVVLVIAHDLFSQLQVIARYYG
jgi:4-amino-4-deoxy-L-arabinose transferase-like glycosyltransferase